MRDIQGDNYKLAGMHFYQKGTLMQVFAVFAKVDEDIEQIMNETEAEHKAKPRAAVLEGFVPLQRKYTLPELSVEDITTAIVGAEKLGGRRELELTDKSGVIKDLGPEKLAQVLVEMGEARKKFLEEGASTYVVRKPAP